MLEGRISYSAQASDIEILNAPKALEPVLEPVESLGLVKHRRSGIAYGSAFSGSASLPVYNYPHSFPVVKSLHTLSLLLNHSITSRLIKSVLYLETPIAKVRTKSSNTRNQHFTIMKTVILPILLFTLISVITTSPTPEPDFSLVQVESTIEENAANLVEPVWSKVPANCKACLPKCKAAIPICSSKCDKPSLMCAVCVAKNVNLNQAKTCGQCLSKCPLGKDVQRFVKGI